MSKNWQKDLLIFHDAFGHCIQNKPAIPIPKQEKQGSHLIDVRDLRIRLITEEVSELVQALGEGSLVEIIDGVCDSMYVIIGTAISYGVHIQPYWDLVQASNMSKIGGKKRIDGKTMKPRGFIGPQKKIQEQILLQKSLTEALR